MYHTTNRTWSPSIFEETSHFISATPFSKTLSTLSSVAQWYHVEIVKWENRENYLFSNIQSLLSVLMLFQNLKFNEANLVSHFTIYVLSLSFPQQIQIRSGNVFGTTINYHITQIFLPLRVSVSVVLRLEIKQRDETILESHMDNMAILSE